MVSANGSKSYSDILENDLPIGISEMLLSDVYKPPQRL
jgi:hypothetical protein